MPQRVKARKRFTGENANSAMVIAEC